MANETKKRFPDEAAKKPASSGRKEGASAAGAAKGSGRPPQKKSASAAPSKKKKQNLPTPEERRAHEICGVVLIAVGLFMGLTHLVSTGLLGETVSGFLFGLSGSFNYVLPFVFIGQGVYAIFTSGKQAAVPRLMLLCAVSLCILSFLHVFFADRIQAEGYFAFLWESFSFGEAARAGGGLLGALFCYPAVQLLGKAGSFVLFPALALIAVVALTNLSLQKTGEKVGRAIKQNVVAVTNTVSAHREQRREERRQEEETRRRLDAEELDVTGRTDRTKPAEKREAGKSAESSAAKEKPRRKKSKADELNMFYDAPELRQKEGRAETEALQEEQLSAEPVRRRFPESAEKKAKEDAYVRTVLREEEDGRYHSFAAPEAEDDGTKAAQAAGLPPKEETEQEQQPAAQSVEERPVWAAGEDLFRGKDPSSGASAMPFRKEREEVLHDLAGRDFGEYEKYLPPLSGRPYSAEPQRTDAPASVQTATQASDWKIKTGSEAPRPAERAGDVYQPRHGAGGAPEEKTPPFGSAPCEKEEPWENNGSHSTPPAVPPASAPRPAAPQGGAAPAAGSERPVYVPPPLSLLKDPPPRRAQEEDPHHQAKMLEEALLSYGISAKVTDVVQGPVITRYELTPAPGVRVNRITNLSDDIALHLAAKSVRIQAPVPGKSVVGIEVPNRVQTMVALKEVIASREFRSSAEPLNIALGKDISGRIATADIAKMPHLLIAGSTGSGKSVCINGIICSILYHASPEDVRLIMVDPKVVELSVFSTIPHLLIPVVTDPKKAAGALRWAVNEMIQRYNRFKQKGARELSRFNEIMAAEGREKLPKVVIIIDELADLMMVAPDDVEDSICRIAQLGRAAGIHLVVATQRPSADVITGVIRSNILTRIAFAVATGTDSRIILDCTGAEKLLGKGDMLFSRGGGDPMRIQGALVTDTEVDGIRQYFEESKFQGGFDEAVMESIEQRAAAGPNGEGGEEDDLLPEAVEVFLATGQASISMLQRRLRIGYNRAARLIDIMEQRGIVSGFEGSKPRKLLMTRAQFAEVFGREPNLPDVGS